MKLHKTLLVISFSLLVLASSLFSNEINIDKTDSTKAMKSKKRLAKQPITDKFENRYKTVTSPYTGKIWLDRNLGASRVCTSYNDSFCYGDYFQWGANTIGRRSGYKANSNLWQGINGKNNPCPKGFRVPTTNEFLVETSQQNVKNKGDAYNNFLKLPSAGYRSGNDGSLYDQGSWGGLWSSSVNGKNSQYFYFTSDLAGRNSYFRTSGFSVRCTKD